MLGGSLRKAITAAFSDTVELLGAPMHWSPASDASVKIALVAGFRTVGRDDASIVNSLGYEAKVVTVRHGDLPQAPRLYDRFVINSAVYIVQSSHDLFVNGELVGWKCFCKGI